MLPPGDGTAFFDGLDAGGGAFAAARKLRVFLWYPDVPWVVRQNGSEGTQPGGCFCTGALRRTLRTGPATGGIGFAEFFSIRVGMLGMSSRA